MLVTFLIDIHGIGVENLAGTQSTSEILHNLKLMKVIVFSFFFFFTGEFLACNDNVLYS